MTDRNYEHDDPSHRVHSENLRMKNELASLRTRLAASDLERIRLRAALIEALDGWGRENDPDSDEVLPSMMETTRRIAELRKLVTP
jgi:hypothetical protein